MVLERLKFWKEGDKEEDKGQEEKNKLKAKGRSVKRRAGDRHREIMEELKELKSDHDDLQDTHQSILIGQEQAEDRIITQLTQVIESIQREGYEAGDELAEDVAKLEEEIDTREKIFRELKNNPKERVTSTDISNTFGISSRMALSHLDQLSEKGKIKENPEENANPRKFWYEPEE